MKSRKIFLFSAMLLALLAGCKEDMPAHPTMPATPPPNSAGTTFLKSAFKVRTEVKPKSSVSADPLVFEVYVDAEGDGNGLVGYKDNVYDVYMVAGEVYVVVTNGTTVHITDLNSHMVPSSLNIAQSNDLKSLGFAVLDGVVVSYNGGTDDTDVVSKYEPSVSSFEPVAISQSNGMTTGELLKYFFDKAGTVYTEPTEPVNTETVRTSFYTNSASGITIHDVVYSLGDFCEPYTYFENMIPQGINTRDEWKEDSKVTFTYVSYISRDGSTTFMTTDGYVQAINTTSEFTFLDDIKSGMPDQELQALLGIGLKKDEVESFKPIREGFTATKASHGYTCSYGDMTIELEMDKKTKVLSAITITNYLDFRS